MFSRLISTASWESRRRFFVTPLTDKNQFACPGCCTQIQRAFSERPVARMGSNYTETTLDETQLQLLQEECIVIDNDDRATGTATKKTCHLLENINNGLLHRAFSVFLFNSAGELLLQKRSSAKITYPDHWTNTCCSHPLRIPGEDEELEALGVKRAAQRKLNHELGILPEQVPLDDFRYLTRIHYRSENVPPDGRWGEHEIDYILFIQRDVKLEPNLNEVQDWRYVSQESLKKLMDEAEETSTLITPWFRLIVKSFLSGWWQNLDELKSKQDHHTIHRMI